MHNHMHVYVCSLCAAQHLGLQPQPGSSSYGCKTRDRFHQPASHCNVTGIPLGAPQKVTNRGHLVQ